MKKIVLSLVAVAFAAGVPTTVLAMKHGGPMNEKLAAACKDKKAGDTVKVDGKDVKCPEKDAKK